MQDTVLSNAWSKKLFSGIEDTINSNMSEWFPNTFETGRPSSGLTSGSLSTSALQNAKNLPSAGTFGVASNNTFLSTLGNAVPYVGFALMGKSIMDSVTKNMSDSNVIKKGWSIIAKNSMQGGPGFFGCLVHVHL